MRTALTERARRKRDSLLMSLLVKTAQEERLHVTIRITFNPETGQLERVVHIEGATVTEKGDEGKMITDSVYSGSQGETIAADEVKLLKQRLALQEGRKLTDTEPFGVAKELPTTPHKLEKEEPIPASKFKEA